MTLAITGSTGHVGGMVATHMRDLKPLLLVRDVNRAPDGYRTAETTYGDHDRTLVALEGVDVLFMVSASESPNRRDEHRTFIRAAADAGVGHIVYTSFFGADPDAIFTLGRDHADAEEAIRESGMRFTFLRDNFYSDLLPFFADGSGVIRGPAGDGTVAAVARADVADAAAAVLRQPGHHVDATYELSGPEALSLDEVAARAAVVLGKALRYERETLDEAYESRRKYSDEQWQLDAWVSTYTAIADDEVSRITGDVRSLTGHAPRTIEEALRSTV
jgi:uncharacterized protein YbjT (DUF2867 family)